MAYVEAAACLYEKLLADDESKDLEIEMSDGVVRAHSIVLCASSDAIAGMLRGGSAATSPQKRISWREHSVEVGRFFLRLLYTGTVDEKDWNQGGGARRDGETDVPVRLLMGSLSIAKVYIITPLICPLTETIKKRLAVNTFDTICASAIKADVMPLRHYCMKYAEDDHLEKRKKGQRVKALKHIHKESADVPKGAKGTVRSCGQVIWDNGFLNELATIACAVEYIEEDKPGVRKLYEAGQLSPEVMTELAGLWPEPVQAAKRARRML